MNKKTILIGLMASSTLAMAMPSKSDLSKAQPLVNELMAEHVSANKTNKKPAKEVAEAAEAFAKEAEGEAAKFLLLKGAINYYVRGGEYDKAADVVAEIQRSVSDLPPEILADIISRASSRITSKNAPRLFAQYRLARMQAKAQKELPKLRASLKKNPNNAAVRRELAELLALTGDWKAALAEFSKLGGKVGVIAKNELEGKAKSLELGDFWWEYEGEAEEAGDIIKHRAVAHYRAALEADEVSGLKKTLVEKRIAELGAVPIAAAEAAVEDESTAGKTPEGCDFKINGNSATLVFPNGVTMEFAKCPPGKFNMLYDYESLKTVPVQITRPFWFSKTSLRRIHWAGAFPEKDRYKRFLTSKDGSFHSHMTTEQVEDGEDAITVRMTEDFKSFFPKGYVVRLPSMAEFEYAYHANTKDRKDPFYTNNQWDLSDKQRELLWKGGLTNNWGITQLGHIDRFLDRVNPNEMLEVLTDNQKDDGSWAARYQMNRYPGKPVGKDPFLWSEFENAMHISRMGHSNIRGRNLCRRSKVCECHIVIGPDLVKEWKEKNAKKK